MGTPNGFPTPSPDGALAPREAGNQRSGQAFFALGPGAFLAVFI